MNAMTKVLSFPARGNHIFYAEESDLHLLPILRSAWMLLGKQMRPNTWHKSEKEHIRGDGHTHQRILAPDAR